MLQAQLFVMPYLMLYLFISSPRHVIYAKPPKHTEALLNLLAQNALILRSTKYTGSSHVMDVLFQKEANHVVQPIHYPVECTSWLHHGVLLPHISAVHHLQNYSRFLSFTEFSLKIRREKKHSVPDLLRSTVTHANLCVQWDKLCCFKNFFEIWYE